jgi:putative CocE/NonD family hydrolase
LLANRFYPADVDRPPLVLLRSPYGRGVALDRMPHLLAERGYQVLYQSLGGTAGSGGEFDGFTMHPADADGMLSWLREQPWFGGVLATWGASYLGFAQWELAAREIPEWKLAVIQAAPSEFAHQFMYPRRRIRAGQRTRLGADRGSHVSCPRWTGAPVPWRAHRPPGRYSARWPHCRSPTPTSR